VAVSIMRTAGIKADDILADGSAPGDDDVRLDKLAIGLSVLCLVHCLALPVALLLAPTIGAVVLGTESPVHWVLLGIALPVSGYALWHGYRHHGHRNALLLGATGLAIMLLAVTHVASPRFETPLTVVGVLALLGAHLLNIRQTARCSHSG
jgi:FtsH-binding integral membrane protein